MQDTGGAGLSTLEAVANNMILDGSTQTSLTNFYTGFRANVPQLFVDIDRDQALSKNVSLDSVFRTLQAYLGSLYVNDFTYLGRTFQVKAQAEGRFRDRPEDIGRLQVQSRDGTMVPLGAFVEEVWDGTLSTLGGVRGAASMSHGIAFAMRLLASSAMASRSTMSFGRS